MTTQDPPTVPACEPDPVERPGRGNEPGFEICPGDFPNPSFVYTATLSDQSPSAADRPKVVYVRLTDANGNDLALGSTAPGGKWDPQQWLRDGKSRAWRWKRSDQQSPLDSVTLKALPERRLLVEVRGRAKWVDAEGKPVSVKELSSPGNLAFMMEIGVGWNREGIQPVSWERACRRVVGDCKPTAAGGLSCKVPGWKGESRPGNRCLLPPP